MNQKFTRWTAIAALAIAGATPVVVRNVRGQEQPAPGDVVELATPPLASLDQLKTEAFLALRVGNFDRGNDLLAKAAERSGDPALGRMHRWTAAFEAQLKRFADERHAAYDKAMVDVQTMRKADHPDAALDLATRAQLLSDNKTEFHNLPWMRSLIADAVTRAGRYESADDWFKAMQVYEDLAAVEPASRDWKEKLKSVTRRVRLLSTYAPEVSKKALQKYLEDRRATDALLAPATTQPSTLDASHATTQRGGLVAGPNDNAIQSFRATSRPTTAPVADHATTLPGGGTLAVPWPTGTTRPTGTPVSTTGPTTKPGIETLVNADAFKTDWHDTLKGVQLQQLTTALGDIYTNYYRDVTYRQLLGGGIEGLEAILTTPGLETAFPGLADPAKRDAFQRYLADWRAMAANATPDNEQALIDQFLSADDRDGLMAVNGRTVGLPQAVLVNEFFDGAHAGLDPFTDIIWPSLAAEFHKQVQGNFSGVGIQIEADNGDLTVVEPLPDSPAEAAGVLGGDVIAFINGQSAKDVTTEQAVHLITGPTGTMVRLTLRGTDGKTRDVNLRRRKIQVSSLKGYTEVGTGKWSYWIDPDSHIAYVRILGFTSTTTQELRTVLNGLGDDCNGLILDLRGNPGGLLPAAIGVCDAFLKSGTIVSTHPDRDNTPNLPFKAEANDDGDEFTKPLVVLINQYSASASEIVSGALKDDHRAILVGERTYGKGSVQQLFPLPPDDDNCTIKLTTSHYYLPSGRCIHREENSTTWGVDPDVTVELTPEQMSATLIARHKMDVFHAVTTAAGGGEGDAKLRDTAAAVTAAQNGAVATTNPSGPPATRPSAVTKPTDLLDIDPQLAAAVLVMRLELAGAKM